MPRKTRKKPKHQPNFILVDTSNPQQPEYIEVEVDNPNYQPANDGEPGNPRKTSAIYNYRESPIAHMYKHRNVTRSQAEAGVYFRKLYEAAGHSGPRAIDWRKEPVDGGGWADPYDDIMMKAAMELVRVKKRLGPEGFALVERVCGQCVFLKDVVHEHTNSYSKRYESKISQQLKDCLKTLAIDWGYENLGIKARRNR